MATRRKFGAIRYGVLLAALAAADQTIPVEPLVISVSLGQADAPTPGTSIRAVPYQRPIFQRTIRGYGFLAGAAATSDATLSASALTTTVSLPTAAASAGGVTVGTTPLIATVSLPTAAAASGISLSAGTLGTTVSLPTATASPGAASLSSGTLGATVSLPTATAAAGGVSVATSPLVATVSLPTATLVDGSVGVSIPIHIRRAVGQRGYRYYGPPSYSTTPESERTISTDPLVVAVSLPTATASASGDPRLPAPFLRIRTVKPYRVNWRPYVAAYGVVEELADKTIATDSLIVAIGLPTVTITSTTPEPQHPEIYRTRLVRRFSSAEPRTTGLVAHYGYIRPPVAGSAQGLVSTTLTLIVSLPTATASPGAVTVSGAPLVVTVSLPTASAGTGSVVSTSPLVTAVSLPTAARSAGAATVATTPLGTAVSLPTAAASAGAVTRTVTPLVVTVSLPTAISTRAVAVAAIGTSVSLPTATLSAGAAPVTTAPLVVTVSLPAPRVLGATTLPDIVRTTLESRMAERILTDRRGKRLVDHRNGDKTVEYNG